MYGALLTPSIGSLLRSSAFAFNLVAVVAFVMCWQVTLVTLGTLPLLAASGYWLVQVNQNAKKLTQSDYSRAGGVALEALSNLRTALSLSALWSFVARYESATAKAKRTGVRRGVRAGLANGCLFGSFILMYLILTLYGTYLLYSKISSDQCNPSGAECADCAPGCSTSAADVFAALLGVAFAGQGAGQVGTWLEAVGGAAGAVEEAKKDIYEKVRVGRALPRTLLHPENRPQPC